MFFKYLPKKSKKLQKDISKLNWPVRRVEILINLYYIDSRYYYYYYYCYKVISLNQYKLFIYYLYDI